jgi:outer membrane biosynthesis protein TonB
VAHFRLRLALLIALGALIGSLAVHAQLTEEEKRAQFLKTRAARSASPDESPTPTPKPKAKRTTKKKSSSPTPTPTAKPAKTPEASEHAARTSKAKSTAKKSPAKEASPKKKKKKKETPSSEKSSKARKAVSPQPSETPEVRTALPVGSSPSPPPAIAASAPSGLSPVPFTAPAEEAPQLTIEKSGYEKRSFFARLFGVGRSRGGTGYRYLTRSVRAAIDRAPVARSRWQFIAVHNSGTRQGNAAVFDYYHRHVRRMPNGLAYHFVIGNGTSTGNGEIEVGDRWRRQINGGHVHSDYLNNIALGICLVGDFNRDQPSRAQLDCCEELIRYLRQRCGKIDNHYAIVKPHRELTPPRWPTDCPGDAFPYSWFRRFQ